MGAGLTVPDVGNSHPMAPGLPGITPFLVPLGVANICAGFVGGIAGCAMIDWHSIAPATLKRMPLHGTSVMLVTVVVTVCSGNLAIGVLVGAVMALLLVVRRVAHVIDAQRTLSADGRTVTYAVHGPLFFGSSNDLFGQFEYGSDPASVVIDFSRSQIWDASTVAALDAIEIKYRQHGASVTFTRLDSRSQAFHGRLTGSLGST
jgi:SulP family sulfate permease